MLVQRQKDLLLLLIKDKKWYTFVQIAKELNCSTKTIQRDIAIIKEKLPANWNLIISRGKGITLDKPADSSCSELKELFIRSEMNFKILDILFKMDINNISSLTEKMYLSSTSLYMYLKKTDHYLKQFDLQLKRKPLKIHGNTINIIFMYQEFYIHSYADHEWPFTAQDESKIYKYLIKIEEKLAIKLSPLYKRKLMYLIAIIVEKKRLGRVLYLDESLVNKVLDTPCYVKMFNLNKEYFQSFFNKEELILILMAITCSKYTYQNLLEYRHSVLQHFHTSDIVIYQDIKVLIFRLEQEFNCNFINNDEFVFVTIQYLKQILSKHHFFPTLNFSEQSTISYVMDNHKDTFYKVKRVYTEWANKYAIKSQIYDEEISTLTLHIEGIHMIERSLKLRVLLLIEDREKWENYLKGILNFHFGSIFKFLDVDIQNIKTYNYTSLNIDLIITTFLSIQVDIPIIRISIIPTRRELLDLKDFCYKRLQQTYTREV
ncbi:Capsule synthesis positive regulator AcpB [Bacillus subtilis]|nr:Capsule synthesis positive regulator AcpB [Bacillus subtilis]